MENVYTSLRNEVTRSMLTVHITQGLMIIVHSAVGLPVVVVLWFLGRKCAHTYMVQSVVMCIVKIC